MVHYHLFRDYALSGMYDESIVELERVIALWGYPTISARVHHAFTSFGYQGALGEWARELEHLHATGEVFCPRMLAHVYIQLGDNKRALYWLERGYQHHEQAGALGDLTWLDFDHEFDALRSDPKFKDLVRRVGLPQT
jgi:hypothetical protein